MRDKNALWNIEDNNFAKCENFLNCKKKLNLKQSISKKKEEEGL